MDALKQKNKSMFFTTFSRSFYWGSVMGWGGVVRVGKWGGVFISRRNRSPRLSCEWPAAVGTLAISSSSAISITKSGDPVGGGGGIVSQSDREPSFWGGRAPFCLKRARRGDEEEGA